MQCITAQQFLGRRPPGEAPAGKQKAALLPLQQGKERTHRNLHGIGNTRRNGAYSKWSMFMVVHNIFLLSQKFGKSCISILIIKTDFCRDNYIMWKKTFCLENSGSHSNCLNAASTARFHFSLLTGIAAKPWTAFLFYTRTQSTSQISAITSRLCKY